MLLLGDIFFYILWLIGDIIYFCFVNTFINLLVFSLSVLIQVGIFFQVFTTAAQDERKNIVLLAFEIIEKIVRDYFPYITETETTTFTDCVNCLIAFTNNRFNKEISLNAIAFLRFCAAKLAEGDLGSSARNRNKEISGNISPTLPQKGKDKRNENGDLTEKEDHLYFWFPLLAGKTKRAYFYWSVFC